MSNNELAQKIVDWLNENGAELGNFSVLLVEQVLDRHSAIQQIKCKADDYGLIFWALCSGFTLGFLVSFWISFG